MDNQPTQSTPPPPPSAPSKTLLLIVGAIILMAVSGVGGYFLGANRQRQPSQTVPTTTYSTSPTATPSPISDETANWKTYSSKYFSFKYPADWTIHGDAEFSNLTLNPPDIIYTGEHRNGTIDLVALKLGSEMSLVDWIKKYAGFNYDLLPESYYSSIEIDNHPAVRINYTNSEELDSYLKSKGAAGGQEGEYLAGYRGSLVYFKSGEFVFEFTIHMDKNQDVEKLTNTFDQILSTFRFTDQ